MTFRRLMDDKETYLAWYGAISEDERHKEDHIQLIIENQTLSGRIKTLEVQQEVMHNFLVEINKYLANKK